MFSDRPLCMIETNEEVVALAERLSRAHVIGVDTESDSMYHYQEKVCLIQFTDAEGDIVVDPLKAKDLSPLKPIFSSRDIVKIYHGADYDVVSLRRDFGFETRELFDTLFAAQFLGYPKLGLADLIDRHFGIKVDKQYQRHDWSQRPLRSEHVEYARGDTHFLLALRELMLRELRKAGREPHQREECRFIEDRVWQGRVFNEDGYLRIKKANTLDDTGLRILRRLYLHRENVAQKIDRPPYKVMSDSILLDIAKHQPDSQRALDQLFPKKHAMKRRHADAIVASVVDGRDDDFEIPKLRSAPKPPRDPAVRLTGRAAERVFEALKAWRNAEIEQGHHRSAFTIANNSTLKRIAARAPTSLEELAAVPEIRTWQVNDHGASFLQVVAQTAAAGPENDDASSKPKRRRKRSSPKAD